MKKVKNLSASRTTHMELAAITDSYLKILSKYFPDHPFIIAIAGLLSGALVKLNEAMAAIRINKLIEEVFDLDQRRDSAFIMFRDLIFSFARTDVATEKAAYNEIWPVIERLGTTLYAEGYLEQSGRLKTLFQEMAKPKKAEALTVLGATERLAKLHTAEQNFLAIYESRLEEDAKKSYPTIRGARRELSPLINDLMPTLRMIARTTPEGIDLPWIDLINEQTDQVMKKIAARRTRRNNQQVSDTADVES